MNDNLGISVIVCTYNRKEILNECLYTLTNQDCDQKFFEVIVVNNYPKEPLTKRVESYKNRLNIKLIDEERPGLSIARNTGLKAANFDWVAYIDDDAKAKEDWLSLAMEIIDENRFNCFGGMYLAWWKYDRPKWLSTNFGGKSMLAKKRSEISKGYNWGGNIFFEKEKLIEVGSFPENLGMKGDGIGYAEETYVQQKFRSLGYKIGFDPALIIYHLVGLHKLNVWWHIKSAYANARDQKHSFPKNYTLGAISIDLKSIFTRPVRAIANLISKKDYYIQNWLIDSISPIFRFIGKLVAISR